MDRSICDHTRIWLVTWYNSRPDGVIQPAHLLLHPPLLCLPSWIFSSLPENKQMLALSATYPESLAQHLTRYMREPTFVRLNPKDMVLKGEILLKLYFTLYQANNMTHQQCLVYILKPYSVNKLTAVPANRDFQNKTVDITQVLRPNCYSPMYVVLARPLQVWSSITSWCSPILYLTRFSRRRCSTCWSFSVKSPSTRR